MRVDIHTHILPKELPDFKSRFGYGGFIKMAVQPDGSADMLKDDGSFFRRVERNCWDMETRLQEIDDQQIDLQILSTVPVMFSYWANGEDGLYLSQFLNDHIAQNCAIAPDRFAALGTVPLQEPKLAVRELERCVKSLGMAGVQIGSHVNGKNLDDPCFEEFFAAADELKAAILLHPWDMLARDRMQKYWLPWLVGMPTECTIAICSLIFGGVLERHQNMRLCVAHGGGSFPFLIGRIEHGFQARPDLVAVHNQANPREYLKRIYFDSATHDAEALRYLLKVSDEDHVMLGSDYPFPLGELRPGTMIEDMDDLSASTKAKLFSKNALTWLNR